jgi:hypothetical protein
MLTEWFPHMNKKVNDESDYIKYNHCTEYG